MEESLGTPPADGGVGDRGVDQLRDRLTEAEKNGLTKRKIEYWAKRKTPPLDETFGVTEKTVKRDLHDLGTRGVIESVPVGQQLFI